jgi:hypothetical protein
MMGTAFLIVGVFAFTVAASLLLWYRADQNSGSNQSLLVSRTVGGVVEHFGTRVRPHRGISSPPAGVAKWHTLYRETSKSQMLSDAGPLWAQTDLLIRDHEGKYWHVIAECTYQSLKIDVKTNSLNELRVRRALFNDPTAYFHAFGEQPDVSKIQKWPKDKRRRLIWR